MHSRRPARILASAIALLTVLSCGDSPTDPALPGAPDSPRPVSASLNPATLQLSALGETAQLTAEIRDQLGSPLQGAQVWWSSSEPAVATVDAAGLVTAIARGEATVTATSGQVGGTVSVAVRQSAHSVTCLDGRAGFYPCDGVDLLGRVSAGGLRPGWLIQDLNERRARRQQHGRGPVRTAPPALTARNPERTKPYDGLTTPSSSHAHEVRL